MKEGDNVVCIRDKIKYDGSKILIKGKKYRIKIFENNYLYITTEIPLWSMGGISCCLERDHTDAELFSKYFITEQNYRKLKLDKINGKYK